MLSNLQLSQTLLQKYNYKVNKLGCKNAEYIRYLRNELLTKTAFTFTYTFINREYFPTNYCELFKMQKNFDY